MSGAELAARRAFPCAPFIATSPLCKRWGRKSTASRAWLCASPRLFAAAYFLKRKSRRCAWSRWVARRTDKSLSSAARDAMAKIAAVLPRDLKHRLEDDALLVGRGWERPHLVGLKLLRRALREERKLAIAYRDDKGAGPNDHLARGARLFQSAIVLVGWCELRQDLRHFRADRSKRRRFWIVHLPCSRLIW